MAEGRKIPYLIELAADDKKIRQQMAKINWEELLGSKGKGFGDVLVSDAKEAKDQIKRTLGGLDIDWSKILGAKEIGQLEQAVAKALTKSRKEIELFAASGDTTGLEKTIKYVSALGEELKGLGSNFDAAGLARGMSAFMKVLTPLATKIEALADEPKKVEAAFDKLFSGKLVSGATQVNKAVENIAKTTEKTINVFARMDGVLKSQGGLEKTRANLEALYELLASDATLPDFSGMSIDQLLKQVQQLDEQWDEIDKKANFGAYTKEQDAQVAHIMAQLVQIDKLLPDGKKILVPVEFNGQQFGASVEDYEKDIKETAANIKKELDEVEEKIKKSLGDSFAEIISKQVSDIRLNLSIDKENTEKLVKEINQYVAEINKQPAIDSIRVGVKHTLDESSNVIEDKTKRAYGDNPADEDAITTELVKKTETRFDRIAKVIGDKQDNILTKTDDWRKKMINAMSINAKDLEFQFGLESNMENTADALFNKLQEYFERPEYALDIKFNTEKIARDLKASIDAEGIEFGIGGGSANIDAKSLMSMLHSLLYGGAPINTSTKTGSANSNSTQKEVANETDEATDSGKEYIKVLDETTIHIDKVIESLRVFAKEANKANASNGSKHVASRLTKMGVDIGAIQNGASDTDIIKMLQTALMSKDEMGKAQGASLVGKLQSMMQTYKMDPKKGSGKVVDALAKDIMELFNINELETELEEELIRRFEQLEIWEGVKKPGKALAALGNVRSTKKKIRTPAMEQIDEAIKYFEAAEEDTAPLQKLKEARKKFEDGGETDEAKAEFEKAALVFYDETKTVFNRLKDRWGDFKGVVQAEGRRPVNIDPKGAYPTRILEIPDDAVIAKVDIFEVFKTIRDIGFTGSSDRRESSQKKAEFEQQRAMQGSSTPRYIDKKPIPKKDVRYEDIEYDTFKAQESGRLPQEVALDATIESLEKQVAEIPELVERIEESKKNIAQLEGIKQQIENEISNLQVQDLPEFQMNAFEQYSKRDSSIKQVLKNASNALSKNDILDAGDISKLDNEQQSLVGRLKAITTNIHNDSEASQEFANKIAEIVDAKKLSKEELEIARSNAAQRGDKTHVDLYRDLLFNRASVDNRLGSYQSQKSALDKNIGKNKNYAQKLIAELDTSKSQSADKATKEAETLATQLIEAKERLYTEAKTYADILNDSSADDKTRETALGKLQETLRGLNQITGKFATIQAYVPQSTLYNSSQQNNVDKWNKKYTNSEVRKLEKELNGLEKQLKDEEDEVKVAELKKKIANTKRNLTRLKKNVPSNVSSKKQTELGNIERQLSEEQSKLFADENRKKAADKASSDLESTKQDATFLAKYNELLEKETSLLEEVNKLKREGSDKSVIDGKTEELKQVTKALDDFLKKEKTVDRTAYAREQAVEYQAQLHTAYRKRSVFDNQIQELNDNEENLTKYGLSGRVGSRARRRALSKATSEYMSSDDVRAQEEAIRKNEQLSWEQRDKQLKELRQKLREEFAKKFDDTNVQQDELDRIAAERAIAEAGREPLDDIIKDLQSQKKTAMRYGAVSDDDLKNDKYLKQNEQYNKNILKLTDDRVKLEQQLEQIKSDDSLDEKKQEKAIKSKQKEIDSINQEIQRNQALIDNRVKLMELHKQEKEDSKQTPEEKALLATEKLVGMKQSLAQAEEKVAARKADYESAKGTENEIKMLEALDKQIKKRDQIQEQIANTEKKIERLGKTTQKTEDARDEVASAVEGTSSGEVSGGLLGLIKEAVGETGVVDLTKVEEILSKILAILSGNGVAGSTRNAKMDAKLARIKELEAKQQLANEQKKTAETVKQVENAKKETAESTNVADTKAHKNVSKTQVYKDVQKSVDAFRTSELTADKEPLNAIKVALDELSKINDQNSQEYIEWQRKLGSALAAYGKKNGIENGKGYYEKVYAELEKNGVSVDHKLPITNKSGISSALVEKGLVTIKEKEAKAKQSEAKAEEKITEEKKEQEQIRFTRKEKKELNRLKKETEGYDPETGKTSEFSGFATENTLRAILEVLNKIKTSGVPKSGIKSSGTGVQQNDSEQDDGEMTELERRVGALKGKFDDAISVGYLDKNNADLAAFNKQLDDIANSDGTVEQLEEMRKKALALGDVVNKTVAKNKRMYSGTTEINAATRQRTNMEARGALDNADLEMVDKYNKAYDELIAKHKEFAVAGTLYDPNNQKTLQNMAIKVKDLGKQLEKSVTEAEQLQQLVDNSGVYNGQSLGSKEVVGKIDDGTFEALAKKRLQELGAEHIKFDKIHKKAIGTKRLDNRTVAELEVKYNDLAEAMFTYQKAEKESLTGVPAFLNGFQKKFNSIMQYLSMTMSIHQVLAELRKGVQYVREIDLALTELKKVTDETEETYDKFLDTAAKTGARLGTTISAVTEATATFAKLGYSMEQATEMAESAIVYKNVGDNIASTEDAADSIISTMKGFKLEASEAMRIVDSFNEVGNRFAITSRGIGEALRLSASALSEGGNSLDESIGLITAANEVVNDPSSVGTALKTLTLRLRGSKTELEEMGEDVTDMATTTSQLQAKLLALTGGQVDIMLDANTFKNSTQILREMAGAWEDMNDIQRASALELMGGKRQANTLSALIQNFDTVEKVIETSANSAGSALKENERYLDSIQGKIDQFNNAMQAMWSNTLDSDMVKGFVSLGMEIIKVIDKIGLLNSALIAIATISMIKNKMGPIAFLGGISDIIRDVVGKVGGFIGSLTGMTAATSAYTAETLAASVANGTLSASEAASIASKNGLALATTNLTAAEAAEMLMKAGVAKADALAMVAKLGLTSSTQALSLADIQAAVSSGALTTAQGAQIASALGLTVANKGLTASLLALWTALWPILAVMAGVAVIWGVVKGIDALIETTEELQEELDGMKSELSDIRSELESVNSEIETTNERMAELLAKDKLTFAEQEELDKLRATNDELERRKDLLEAEEKTKARDTGRKAAKIVDKVRWEVFNESDHWWRSGMQSGEEEIQDQFDDYKQIKKNLDNATTETDREKYQEELDKKSAIIDEYLIQISDALDGVEYGDSKESDEALDYLAETQDTYAITRGSASAKTNAIKGIINKPEFESMSKAIDYYVSALKDGDESAGESISAIISDNKDFVEDLEARGLEAQDAIDYFTNLGDNARFDTLKGKTEEIKNAIAKLPEAFNNIGQFMDDDKVDTTAIADYFKGTSDQTREEIAKLIQDINDGKIDIDHALKKFELFGVQSVVEIEISEVQTNFKDVFTDLENADGLINTFQELADAIGSTSKAIDALNAAQAEMDYSGRVSIETALKLMESTDDYSKVLTISEGKLVLAEDAEENLVEARMEGMKASALKALEEAKAARETTVLARSTAETALSTYNSAMESEMAAAVTATAWDKVLAAAAGLWAGIQSLFTSESWTEAYDRAYQETLNSLGGDRSAEVKAKYASAEEQARKAQLEKDIENADKAIAEQDKEIEKLQGNYDLVSGLNKDNIGDVFKSDDLEDPDAAKDKKLDEAVDRFQKEMDYWENRIGANQARYEQLQNEIDLLEAKGQKADVSYYQEQAKIEQERLWMLEQQRQAAQQFITGYTNDQGVWVEGFKEGTEEWWEWQNVISDIEGEIDDVTASLVDLQDAVGEIDTYKFEEYNNRLDNIVSKLGTIRDLIAPNGEEDWFDDEGNWTEAGVASLGTYVQELESYKNGLVQTQVDLAKYSSPYEGNEDYYASFGIHSEQEYYDKTEELINQQYDFASSISDTEQSIVDMYENSIDAVEEYVESLVDSYNDYIDSVKEALDAERDLYDFKKNVQKQSKDIAAIERRIASLSGSTNAADIAERRKLEAELYDSRESLNNTYYDHARTAQDDALDAEAVAYEETMTQMVEGMRTSLETATTDMGTFLEGVTAMVSLNAGAVLDKYKAVGVELSPELTAPWEAAKTAVGNYSGDALALMGQWTKNGFLTTFQTSVGQSLSSPWSIGTTAAGNFKDSVSSVMDGVLTKIETNVKKAKDALATITNVIPTTAAYADGTVGNSYSGNNTGTGTGTDGGSPVSKKYRTNAKLKQGGKIFVAVATGDTAQDAEDKAKADITNQIKKAFPDDYLKPVWQNARKKITYNTEQFAKGTTGTSRDQWAITDEQKFGDELVLVPGKDGNLSFMRKGTGVVPADMTQKLFELAQIPTSDLMNKNLTAIVPNITKNDFKNEFNFESLVHVDTVDSDTLPKLEKMVDKKIDDFSRALNYSLKKFAR